MPEPVTETNTDPFEASPEHVSAGFQADTILAAGTVTRLPKGNLKALALSITIPAIDPANVCCPFKAIA